MSRRKKIQKKYIPLNYYHYHHYYYYIIKRHSHIRESAKSRPTCQLPIFTCQRAKSVSIIELGVPTCEKNRVPIFQLRLPEGVPVFQLFFNFSIFELFLIANFKAIWAILENSSRLTKNLNFEHLQNFIKEKPCHPKIFDIVFNRARGINRTIIPLV